MRWHEQSHKTVNHHTAVSVHAHLLVILHSRALDKREYLVIIRDNFC